jgi:hypothetical protein
MVFVLTVNHGLPFSYVMACLPRIILNGVCTLVPNLLIELQALSDGFGGGALR